MQKNRRIQSIPAYNIAVLGNLTSFDEYLLGRAMLKKNRTKQLFYFAFYLSGEAFDTWDYLAKFCETSEPGCDHEHIKRLTTATMLQIKLLQM